MRNILALLSKIWKRDEKPAVVAQEDVTPALRKERENRPVEYQSAEFDEWFRILP